MYKTLVKQLRTYDGLQLWVTEKVPNTNKIQQLQNIVFRKITNDPLQNQCSYLITIYIKTFQ